MGGAKNRKVDLWHCNMFRSIMALLSAFDHDHISNELLLLGRELIELIKA